MSTTPFLFSSRILRVWIRVYKIFCYNNSSMPYIQRCCKYDIPQIMPYIMVYVFLLFAWSNEGNKYQNNNRVRWAQKKFVTRVHTLSYFLHDVTNPQMTIKMTIFSHHPRVSLARFSFCWWCHNRLLIMSQWSDNCDAIKWIVISNSLDIDFIHGDIHGRSCKKYQSIILVWAYY